MSTETPSPTPRAASTRRATAARKRRSPRAKEARAQAEGDTAAEGTGDQEKSKEEDIGESSTYEVPERFTSSDELTGFNGFTDSNSEFTEFNGFFEGFNGFNRGPRRQSTQAVGDPFGAPPANHELGLQNTLAAGEPISLPPTNPFAGDNLQNLSSPSQFLETATMGGNNQEGLALSDFQDLFNPDGRSGEEIAKARQERKAFAEFMEDGKVPENLETMSGLYQLLRTPPTEGNNLERPARRERSAGKVSSERRAAVDCMENGEFAEWLATVGEGTPEGCANAWTRQGIPYKSKNNPKGNQKDNSEGHQ